MRAGRSTNRPPTTRTQTTYNLRWRGLRVDDKRARSRSLPGRRGHVLAGLKAALLLLSTHGSEMATSYSDERVAC